VRIAGNYSALVLSALRSGKVVGYDTAPDSATESPLDVLRVKPVAMDPVAAPSEPGRRAWARFAGDAPPNALAPEEILAGIVGRDETLAYGTNP
jgi:hypothetical protein